MAKRPTYGELAKRITSMLALSPGALDEEHFVGLCQVGG